MIDVKSSQQSEFLTVAQTLQQAIAHHRAGQFQDAERFYRAILQFQPNHSDANHNLGVLAIQMKQPAVGLPFFKAALEANPGQDQYWLSYIDALIQTDQRDIAQMVLEQGRQQGLQGEAIDTLARQLTSNKLVAGLANEDPPSLPNLPPVTPTAAQNGVIETNTIGKHTSVKKSASCAEKGPSPKEINELAALFNGGLYAEARLLAHTLTVRFPLHGFAWRVLGAVFKEMGRSLDALRPMQIAVELSPSNAEAHSNLGAIFQDLGDLNEAEASYKKALKLKPDNIASHYGLGNLFVDMGRWDSAAGHFNRCIQIDPKDSLGVRLVLARLGIEPTPMKAPSAQLDQLYAKRAQSWDQGKAYRGHELVAQALRELSSKAKIDILDAGCGTGLVGSLVRDLANILDGVDLSSAMLEKAREKSIYNSLELGDLVSFMNGKPETYDAITCAATLIHFGDLMPAIDAAAVSLRDDGLFVFTLFPNDSHEPNQEVVIAQNGSLARGGCYAHSQGYLRRLAEANEFVVEVLNLDIHEYHNKVVPIWCFVVALRRRCRSN